MKNLNTSIYDFPTLRDPAMGYVYVDKTAQLYEIAKPNADRIYYLPRPRRFGKSLMISTLKALFEGRRELFRGLAIENTDWNWEAEVYPVLHLDMSRVADENPDVFKQNLNNLMRNECAAFGVPFDERLVAETNFDNLLIALHAKSANSRYVLLIDEYDAPIAGLLDTVEKRKSLDAIRSVLHKFYVKAKVHCGDMRFLMVTGVSKFAKTSIFSAFNNPCDLTLDARVADLLGYTHEEMERYFHEHIQAFADKIGVTYDQMFAQLLAWYDGYQFCPDKLVKVVNPVSLGRALSNAKLGNYWEATAGSTLIFEALKSVNKTHVDVVSLLTLSPNDAWEIPSVSILYQNGYLTIDEVLDDRYVSLKIPNKEMSLNYNAATHTIDEPLCVAV